MPRYFFNARLGDHMNPDTDGVELERLDVIKEHLLDAVLVSGLALSGEWVFEITDEGGDIVMVPISDLPTRQ